MLHRRVPAGEREPERPAREFQGEAAGRRDTIRAEVRAAELTQRAAGPRVLLEPAVPSAVPGAPGGTRESAGLPVPELPAVEIRLHRQMSAVLAAGAALPDGDAAADRLPERERDTRGGPVLQPSPDDRAALGRDQHREGRALNPVQVDFDGAAHPGRELAGRGLEQARAGAAGRQAATPPERAHARRDRDQGPREAEDCQEEPGVRATRGPRGRPGRAGREGAQDLREVVCAAQQQQPDEPARLRSLLGQLHERALPQHRQPYRQPLRALRRGPGRLADAAGLPQYFTNADFYTYSSNHRAQVVWSNLNAKNIGNDLKDETENEVEEIDEESLPRRMLALDGRIYSVLFAHISEVPCIYVSNLAKSLPDSKAN